MIINNDLIKKLLVFIEYYPPDDSLDIELIGKSRDLLPLVDDLSTMEIQSDFINVKSDSTGEGFSLSVNNATNADDAISLWYAPHTDDTKNNNILYPVTLYVLDVNFYNKYKDTIHNRFNIQHVDHTFNNAYDRIDERIWYIITKHHFENVLNRNIILKNLNHFESRQSDWYTNIINNGNNRDDNLICLLGTIEDITQHDEMNFTYKTKAFICGNELTTEQNGYYDVFVTKE